MGATKNAKIFGSQNFLAEARLRTHALACNLISPCVSTTDTFESLLSYLIFLYGVSRIESIFCELHETHWRIENSESVLELYAFHDSENARKMVKLSFQLTELFGGWREHVWIISWWLYKESTVKTGIQVAAKYRSIHLWHCGEYNFFKNSVKFNYRTCFILSTCSFSVRNKNRTWTVRILA